jgi:hypothetical protein
MKWYWVAFIALAVIVGYNLTRSRGPAAVAKFLP